MTFEEFAATRLPALLNFAAVLAGDRAIAEDLAQDVLIRAYSRWDRIGGLDQPELYVRKMILNEFLSWRRRSWRLIRRATPAPSRLGPGRITRTSTPNGTRCSASSGSCPGGSAPCSFSAITKAAPIKRLPSYSAARRALSAATRPGRSRRCA